MSKGAWKKGVCSCGTCKKCKDRAYLKGVVTKRIPQGRKDENDRREKRMIKDLAAAEKLKAKLAARVDREIRADAIKHNMIKYGYAKAKFIAVVVR